jgi:hypothetical protein
MDRAGRDLLRVGLPTQKTSVEQTGFAPRPQPRMSRITPPRPVFAPPYGSIALGWLWVSTLKQTFEVSSNSMMPGVVLEDADAPGLVEVLGRLGDRRLEQVRDDLPLERDVAGEGLVLAVLAPGLGDRLELDVARLAPDLLEVVADRVELLQVEREGHLLAQLEERGVVELEDRDGRPS